MSKSTNTSTIDEQVTNGSPELETTQVINNRPVNRVTRRSFFAGAGLAAGAVVVAGCSSSSSTTTSPTTTTPPTTTTAPTGPSEADVLNFALNLEYLEASFYLYITTGSGLQSADMGSSPGAVTGGAQVTFTDPNVQALATQLAADEQAHVQFLRSVITKAGATPVSMPALNLAALGTVTDDATFLSLARQLETVGVSAYEGGISAFVSDTTGLTYAATVHDTEAQHEGLLRQFLIAKNITTSTAVDANDRPPSLTQVFNTDSNGLNTIRTPSQVLQIVYGTPGVTGTTKGGFYPNGMNNANSALTTS